MKPYRTVPALLVLIYASSSAAAPTPWTFDFDPNLAEDPAYVNQHLSALKAGLPGLPPEGIGELSSKQTKLYFYQDVIDALVRARDSGPGQAPAVTRTPTRCVAHSAFAKPSLLLDSPPPLCDLAQQGALAAFDAAKIRTCERVEFPETYVYDHTPLGWILPPTLADFDILIAIIGEALTHPIYPTGLLPPDFFPQARKIIAKVRYHTLKAELAARKTAYQDALNQLQGSSHCFDPAALASFQTLVGNLTAELNAVESDLDALYSAGVAQAVADRKAIEAQGRMRADLPYPALSDRERELLAFYVGGICWRIRGAGLIYEGKMPLGLALTFVSAPYQLIADMAGGVDGKDVGFQIYLNENGGYAEWFDMGTTPGGNDKYADLVQMTNRGKDATALSAPLLQGRGFDIRHLVAGGLMMGPCYYYIWEELPGFIVGPPCQPLPGYPLPPNTPGCLDEPHYMQFLECPTASGELCTGAALSLGLVKTLLWGKPGSACTPDCVGKPCGADDTCGGTCSACNDAGMALPPDGSGPWPDGGVPPGHDGGVPPPHDASVVQGDGTGTNPPPPPRSDGCCDVAHAASAPPLVGVLLLWWLVAVRHSAAPGRGRKRPR